MSEIFSHFLTQLFYFFGIIVLIGFLISLINRHFYRLVNYNRGVCLATGLLGTPVHELSHAFMCVVFRHKINEIKLFQADDENGVLGYVRHSYNPKNLWQKIGNYFIGTAPIVCGSLVILLALSLLLPSSYSYMESALTSFANMREEVLSLAWFEAYFEVFFGIVVSISQEAFDSWEIWVFLVASMCIALHMNLSGADIKNALPSVPFLLIALLAINCLLGFVLPDLYEGYLDAINIGGGFLSGVLLLAVVLSLLYLLVALLIKAVIGIFRKVLP